MFDTAVFDTLSMALEEADLLPETGGILCLRAEAVPFLMTLPKDRLTCHNSFKPDLVALKAAGFNVLAPETETFPPAALTIILPPRQRDETRALFARAMRDALACPIRWEPRRARRSSANWRGKRAACQSTSAALSGL